MPRSRDQGGKGTGDVTWVNMWEANDPLNPSVIISPIEERCRDILHELREAERRRMKSPQHAASMAGRLQHVMMSMYGHLGRAVMYPIHERAQEIHAWDWTEALSDMLRLLEVVLKVTAMPVIPGNLMMRAREEKHCCLWTQQRRNGSGVHIPERQR